MKLVHISDIHINPEPILGNEPVANFACCQAHIAKHHADADMVVITGDLTHHGLRASFLQLREMLEQWIFKPYLVIGNHDQRETFGDVFPHVPRDADGYLNYTVSRPEGCFVFLDTVQSGTHAGHFCAARQAWLIATLENCRRIDTPVYLFMHHNPVAVGVKSSDSIGLVDGDAFRSILKEFRQIIRHIFFGHCHFILSGSVCGIPMSAPRSTNHPCVPDFSGRDALGFAPFPATYNVCLIEKESIVIHSIDFQHENTVTWLQTTSDGWIDETIPNEVQSQAHGNRIN